LYSLVDDGWFWKWVMGYSLVDDGYSEVIGAQEMIVVLSGG
jgi:hypothetical protein